MDNQRLRKLARVFVSMVFLDTLAINIKVTLEYLSDVDRRFWLNHQVFEPVLLYPYQEL